MTTTDLNVASRPTSACVLRDVHGVVVPVLDGDDGELGAVADEDLDVGGERGVTGVVDDDDGLGEGAELDDLVAEGGAALAVHGDRGPAR